jgi:hypothetical protein
MRLPCAHLLLIIQREVKNIIDYCCQSWLKQTYLNAYASPATDHHLTFLTDLKAGDTEPPMIARRGGRPRKRRIESQAATLELETQPRRQYKCSRCPIVGHNARNSTVVNQSHIVLS